MAGAIILQIVLISLNAVFASAEIAVLSVNQAKLERLVAEGNHSAKTLVGLTQNPSRFLSTIQVAITLAGLLGSAYAANHFSDPLVAWLVSLGIGVPAATLDSVCVFVITLLLSYFSIVFGELVPKRLAMKHAEKISLSLAGMLSFVSRVFAPFVWLLTRSTNGILRLMRINPDEQDDAVTEEEIRMMLESGSAQGTIDSLENEMIQNVFEFDDISISEVCTHRRDVAMLYVDDELAEWKELLNETRHAYYPICGEDTDDIIGVLSSKQFFRCECSTVDEAIASASEKPFFVPENIKADVLFYNMKRSRSYFAVVIDEYGGMSGIITMHDLLELLVGDLADKEDEEVQEIVPLGDNRWRIVGRAPLNEVSEVLGMEFDAEDCDTFGGYLFGLMGAVPDDGETLTVETDILSIFVERVEDHCIESTIVTRTVPPASQEEAD